MRRVTYNCFLGIFLLLSYSKTHAQFAELENDDNQNWKNTICNPIKIGDIEVANDDFENVTWDEASYFCKTLPPGWRLPTKDELIILYQNRDKLPSLFKYNWITYWSSTKATLSKAWRINSSGFYLDEAPVWNGMNKRQVGHVRVVRSIDSANTMFKNEDGYNTSGWDYEKDMPVKNEYSLTQRANVPSSYEYFASKSKRIEIRNFKKIGPNGNTTNSYLFDLEKKIRLTPNYYIIDDLTDKYANQMSINTNKKFYLVNFTGESNASWGIINHIGKTVISPIIGSKITFNFAMDRIYHFYSICEESYNTGKTINGHGARCNICKIVVSITKVYDFNFNLVNTVLGEAFQKIQDFIDSDCGIYNFDRNTGLYRLPKIINSSSINLIVDKDLKIVNARKNTSPSSGDLVQNEYGNWVLRYELASNKKNTPIESTTNQSNTDDELRKAILRFGNAVKASPKSTDAIIKDLEVEINREFNSSKTPKNDTKNKSNNDDAISQIMAIYWKSESDKIHSLLKEGLDVGNARPSKNASESSLSKSSSSSTSNKHSYKVTVTWNNPNCGNCAFPRPSAQNGSIDYFYERSGSYKVKPKCPICGKTQYNTIDGFTNNIGTSNQGSKVVTITCN